MPLPPGVYRADHVGSLLRPKEVLEAHQKSTDGNESAEELRKLEDKHIAAIVKKQLDAGLRSITDGEYRREYFHLDFLRHLDGVKVEGLMKSTHSAQKGMMPPRLIVTGKLGHSKPIQLDDFKFLQSQLDQPNSSSTKHPATVKVCIPSPTMLHFRGNRDTINATAYPSMDDFFADLATVYKQELHDLYTAGCRFIQLDDTNLAYLCDEAMAKAAETRHGESSSDIARRYIDLINATISSRPKDLKIGIHLCRGNYKSQYFAQGGYEPVAEVLFTSLNVDVFFLEYDDARSGDFSPLRFLPENKFVVLGVMCSKVPELDDKDTVVRRLNEAAAFCPRGLDQLCLSHQCGFASVMDGNELSEEQEWDKIRLEVEIAKSVWGEDLSK